MKRNSTKTWVIAGVVGLTWLAAPAEAQFHFVQTTATLTGPSALNQAHVGDEMTLQVQVWNLDEFLDSITVNSVRLVVHHGRGDVVIPNLLSSPIDVPFFGDYAEISASFVVQPDDGDYLAIEYEVVGTDNWDGFSPGLPASFSHKFGNGVSILKPAIDVSHDCRATPGYPFISFSGFVTNTGNTPLSNVAVVSDNATPDDPSDDWSLNPGSLIPGAVSAYSGTFTATTAAARNTVTVRGTDALGRTVTTSNTRPIPSVAPTLSIARAGAAAIRVSWPESAEGFQLESTETVDRAWTPVTEVPTSIEGMRSVTMTMTSHRFFRLARP